MMPFFIIAGAINAGLAVALGAFGAHLLEGNITDHYLAVWEKAVLYQMFHAIGLVAIGILMHPTLFGSQALLKRAGSFILAGIIIFSGSLYTLSLTGIGVLGAITPFGGVAFMIGWLFVIVAMKK